jgi:hypothetical protein
MKKYIVEGNIDFFQELQKSSTCEDDNNRCQITGEPLGHDFVQLKCGHSFNYEALFADVYQQKKKSNVNECRRVSIKCIRCPYCRSIHPELLPEKAHKVFGVNFYDETLDSIYLMKGCDIIPECSHPNCKNTFGKRFGETQYFCQNHLGKEQKKVKQQLEQEYQEFIDKKNHTLIPKYYCQCVLSRGPRKGEECKKRVQNIMDCCSSHKKSEKKNNVLVKI